MAKAIKHIKAGLLNLEIIGTVPERELGRRRSGRSRPTCAAQQFYNDKCSWRELELVLAANFGARDWVLTSTYDDLHLPPGKPEAYKLFRRFIRSLRAVRRKRGAEPVDIHYYRELAKYLTKEAREFGRARPGERTWRPSRKLERYEVEYIEIHSDSVTLAPPPGAVDYVQFAERNPYGFADCVGARYLLFPQASLPEYSYTRGRK